MRALRSADVDLRFIGRGGPQMKTVAGTNFQNWIDKSGVLGLWEVIKHYGYFRKQFHATLHEIEKSKPDAVVLIDYPGFNLRLARALRKQAPLQKVIYYISPQVWAWNRGRIQKMARWLDLMLCIFPFEADLYNESGLRTIFVGHPMIERLPERQPSQGYGSARKIDIEREVVVANGSHCQMGFVRLAAVSIVAIRAKSELKCSGCCLPQQQKIGSRRALVGDDDDITGLFNNR